MGMFLIWKNFFAGDALRRTAIIVVLSMIGMIEFVRQGWILAGLAVNCFVYGLVLPAAVFLIDYDRRSNPHTPKTLANLGRILAGKNSK
jgi:hypothetical protein